MRCRMILAGVLFVSFLFPGTVLAVVKKVTLMEALAKKLVKINGVGNGGARGKCLTLEMTNQTKQPLSVTVDPAMIFVPSDTNYQNLVVAGSETVEMRPGACEEVRVETFCGKSYARGPVAGLPYSFWKQGSYEMVQTMNYIREQNFMDNLGQNAVWTFTNAHNLSRVYNIYEQDRSRQLVEFIAKTRGIPVPEYFTEYKIDYTPGAPMVVQNSARHYVEMEWKNSDVFGHSGKMHVLVYREDGTLYKEVNEEVCDAKSHKTTVRFDPKVDIGNFYVVLKDDYNNIWDRKNINVGVD